MEKKRYDLINHLIKTYNLNSYCEIGTQVREVNFDRIQCAEKFCIDIDPKAKADFTGSSDDFFLQNEKVYDIYFLDGLHTAEQVKKDFVNAWSVLSPNGFIVLHDCNPLIEEHTIVPRPTERGHWNGDVYKLACQLSTNWISYRTIDIDNGCGVFCKNTQEYSLGDIPTWSVFNENRNRLLNLRTWNEFIDSNSH